MCTFPTSLAPASSSTCARDTVRRPVPSQLLCSPCMLTHHMKLTGLTCCANISIGRQLANREAERQALKLFCGAVARVCAGV